MDYRSAFSLLIFWLFLSYGGNTTPYTPDLEAPENDTLQVELLNEQAWQYKNSMPDTARQRALVAIELSKKLQYQKGIADGYHHLGMIQWRLGDRAGALDFYLRALDIRRQINDSLGLGRSYNNIGNVYYAQANYDSARVYYQRSQDIRLVLKDTSGMIYSLSNLGDVALQNDNVDRAILFYQTSENLAKHQYNPVALAHVLGRMGKLQLITGRTEDAKAYWREAISFAKKTDDPRLLASCLQELARIRMVDQDLKSLSQQEDDVRRSMNLAIAAQALDLQTEAAVLLAQLSAFKGDYDQAYFYQEHSRQLTRLLLDQRKNEAVDAVNKNYAAERAATQKLIQEREERRQLTEKNNRLSFTLLIIGLLLLVALAASIFVAYRKQQLLAEELEIKNEELAARYTDLRSLAYIASHDLKEPLRNIGSFASLFQRRYKSLIDPSGQEYLDYVMRGVNKMDLLLNDVLDLANISELSKQGMSSIALEPLIKKSFHQQKKVMQVDARLSLKELPSLNANATLLSMLFEQLFQNALKFRGDATTYVEVDHYLDGKCHVLTFRDNGIGIDPAYHDQVFHAFKRLDPQRDEGTGIGLAICRRVVEVHKGKIWLESEVGKGTKVFVSLPAW